jgi:hypothetical protein
VSVDDDDWRLSGQERDLQGAALAWRDWLPPPPTDVRAWRMRDGTVRESATPDADVPIDAIEQVEPRGWEHDHCSFCWSTFMSAEVTKDDAEIINAGYTIARPERSTFWICARCFDDFRDRFEWTVVTDGTDR